MVQFLEIFLMKAPESRKIRWVLWWSVNQLCVWRPWVTWAWALKEDMPVVSQLWWGQPPGLARYKRGGVGWAHPLPFLHGSLCSPWTPGWLPIPCHLSSEQYLISPTSAIHFLHQWVLSWLVERTSGRKLICMSAWMLQNAIICTLEDVCLPKEYL